MLVSIHLNDNATARELSTARKLLDLVESAGHEANVSAGSKAEAAHVANPPATVTANLAVPGDITPDIPPAMQRTANPAAAFASPAGGVVEVAATQPGAAVPAVPFVPADTAPAPVTGISTAASAQVSAQSAPPSVPPVPPSSMPVPAPAELDVDGLPWDARLHAGTKTKNQDGRWKGKRGVSEADKGAIVASLRLLYPAPAVAAPPAPVAAPPAPPAAAAVTAVDWSKPSDGTFVGFMRRVQALSVAGKVSSAQIHGFCVAVGLTKMPDLAANVAKIPEVDAHIDAHLMTAQ